MKFILRAILFFTVICVTNACKTEATEFKIAFGSCAWHDHPLPIFHEVVKHDPDLFVFLGDNIYGDTKVMDTLRAKYARLGAKESYQALKNNVEIIATWDDHDFGWNDAGRHYAYKEESKEIFFDFFEEPEDSDRRKHPGIYGSYIYLHEGKSIQLIVLDTRTFRDNIKRYDGSKDGERKYFYPLDYIPYTAADSTLLGSAQWSWLEQRLKEEADLRIVASSTQFGIEYNGYEAWANFPHEQERFLKLIKKTNAEGVIFISGDVHYAEISKLESDHCYPIYDITSSGLSSTWHFATGNENRIEGPIMDNHFGLLRIDLSSQPAKLVSEIWDIRGNKRVEYGIDLNELQF